MTEAEIKELEVDLRLHKEDRLRLRAENLRLGKQLAEAKSMLLEILFHCEDYELAIQARDWLEQNR